MTMFMTMPRRILLTMRNVSHAVGKIKTHILPLITFPPKSAVYVIMSKNFVQPDRPQKTI